MFLINDTQKMMLGDEKKVWLPFPVKFLSCTGHTFFSSPIFFFHFISQKHDFLRFYWARVKSRKSSLFSLNFGEMEISKQLQCEFSNLTI